MKLLEGKVNKCFKGIGLEIIFKNFLWENKKVINIFNCF